MKLHRGSPFRLSKVSAAVAALIIVLLVLTVVSLYDVNYRVDVAEYDVIRRAAHAAAAASFSSPSSTPRQGVSSTSSSSPPPSMSSPAPAAGASFSSPSTSRPGASSTPSSPSPAPDTAAVGACDVTKGEWVPDTEPPYYTNLTCPFIDDHQNCMKFGKPSLEFTRWRWRPDGCELPRFDAARFLEAMRGKSVAFVGDSLARNHLKSLLCILSKAALPVEVVQTAPEMDVTERAVRQDYRYIDHNFTASLFWSPFLVQANLSDASGGLGQWDLHLDAPDARWAAHVAEFDHVVLSSTNWFFRPSVYHEGGRAVGRNGGSSAGDDVAEMPVSRAVRAAFRTALGEIAASDGFRGKKAVVRTLTPAHFENGAWNTGGDCVRTRPFRRGQRALGAIEAEFRAAQVDAVRETEAAAQRNGVELLLLDITEAMALRPDGHPSRYGHPPGGTVEGSFVVDCLHWCLPGPIDLWSELLFHMLQLPAQQ